MDCIHHARNINFQNKPNGTVFHSGLGTLGCFHTTEAWANLGPKARLSWSWGSWGWCTKKMPSLHLESLVHGGLDPNPPDPGRLLHGSTTVCMMCSKTSGPSRLRELWIGTCCPVSPRWVPTSVSYFSISPPDYQGLPSTAFCTGLGFVWGWFGGRYKEAWALAHSTLIYNPGTWLFSRAPVAKKSESGLRKLRCLVDSSHKNNLKTNV